MRKILLFLIFIFILASIGGISYYLINNQNKEINSEDSQDIVSSIPLVYEMADTEITTYEANAYFTLTTNKEVSLVENPRAQIFLSEKSADNKTYFYVVKALNLGTGPSTFKFEITDSIDKFSITKKINRQAFTLPLGLKEITEWPNTVYTANGDNLLAKLDKTHRLPQDYVPSPTLDIAKDLLLYTNSPEPYLIREEAGQALKIMANALQKETGKNLVITSAYRDFNTQLIIYSGWVKSLGQEEADKVSARPGYSEHQLGTVVDFVDQETGLNLTNEFDKGVSGRWLKENAHKYGFIQPYPENKSEQTGYSYEAWHWRYIGISNATEVKESGLTLKEWLDK